MPQKYSKPNLTKEKISNKSLKNYTSSSNIQNEPLQMLNNGGGKDSTYTIGVTCVDDQNPNNTKQKYFKTSKAKVKVII